MKIITLRRSLLVLAASLLLAAGVATDALAQSRGGAGRGPGAGGAVRPGGPSGPGGPGGPRREIIIVPAGRQGSPIDDFPWPARGNRGIPEIERPQGNEQERARREERTIRDERRRQEEETRREETKRREATRRHEEEANRFQKLGRWLEVSPERLQNFYLEAKAANPNLRLSQFFAAFVIANRLHSSHPSVTPQAILRGLDSGMSLERTLGALGLTAEEVKATLSWAERVVNQLKP